MVKGAISTSFAIDLAWMIDSDWTIEMDTGRSLAGYLALEYPFHVIADPEGGYVVVYPDLPGCMTQVEDLAELPALAAEARELWIETEYELGHDIPLPSHPEEYSGKFNLRLPRSLHRSLATAAEHEGVSLNQYVVCVLARGDTQARIERRLDAIEATLHASHPRRNHSSGVEGPAVSPARPRPRLAQVTGPAPPSNREPVGGGSASSTRARVKHPT